MKRLFVVLLLCVLYPTLSNASFNPFRKKSPWHEGVIVLQNGDTLRGQIKFTRKVPEGLLQLMKGKKVQVLTVKDVLSFSYYDKMKKKERRFLTLSLTPDLSTREHEVFIEYLYGNNKLSLLNYKALGFSDHSLQINPFRTKTVVNKRYLLDNESGEILPLNRDNVIQLMDEERMEIISYLQSSGLRLKSVEDYISLLDYHQVLIAGL